MFGEKYGEKTWSMEKKRGSTEKKDKSTEKMYGGREKTEDMIIHLISEAPQVTIKELSDALSLSTSAIEKQLAKLKKAKRIQRIGPDKGGYWKVIK